MDDGGLQVGTVIGGYELDRRIGKGGMAEVWVARKARSRAGKFVAIKVILPHLAGQERYSRMFRHEADLSSMLSHSNIVQVFDEGEDNGISYLVMEYVDGVNLVRLREAIKSIGNTTIRESLAAHVVGQLLHALSYAHSITTHEGEALCIVHRDVSPQNVLVSNSGDVKLADFGVAHTVIEESSGVHIKGKLRYMSPEQLGGRTKEPTIDLYAAGAILHELLEGMKFRGEFDDDRMLYSQILSGAMPKLSRPCSPQLDRVRQALLAGEPEQRVQTADEALAMLREFPGYRDMRLDLSRIVGGLTGVSRPRTGPGTPRMTPTPQPVSAPSMPAPQEPSAVSQGFVAPADVAAPSVAAPSVAAPSLVVPVATPMHGGVASPPTVMLPGPDAAGQRIERTAYFDAAATHQPVEPTAYLQGGGLPLVSPTPSSAMHHDATDTENRPRATTIPDRLAPMHGIADEQSMTRFPVRQRSTAGFVALIAGGVVLALGGAGVTGWMLTRSDDEPTPAIAKKDDAPTKPAAADPTPPPLPEEDHELVIGDAQEDVKEDAEPENAEPEAAEPEPAAAEAEPEPAPEPEPADTVAETPTPASDPPKTSTRSGNKSRGGAKRPSSGSSAAPPPAANAPLVVVHFRKEAGVDKAWVKIAGASLEIKGGAARKIPSGQQRVYKKHTADDGYAACGRFDLKPDTEWILFVGSGSCRVQKLGG